MSTCESQVAREGKETGSPGWREGRSDEDIRAVGFAASLVACTVVATNAQAPMGALAIDERRVDQWGWAVDHETAEAAGAAALRECGAGCSVVSTFAGCGAFAADQNAGSTAYGWGDSYASADVARKRALAECGSRGGTACIVRAWGCNGPVAEEALGLGGTAQQQIQQALRAAGYDPGGADGLVGPRTRAAIRSWQRSGGARETGYLDGPAAAALLSGGAARRASASGPGMPAGSGTQQTAAAATPSAELERLFWQSIMASTDPADFEAYLEQFPSGVSGGSPRTG